MQHNMNPNAPIGRPEDGAPIVRGGAPHGAVLGAPLGASRRAAAPAAPVAPCPLVPPGGHDRRPARPLPRAGDAHGAGHGAPHSAPPAARPFATPDGAPADAEYVVYRLQEAGTALLSLPATGYSTQLRTSRIEVVRSLLDGYGWDTRDAEPGRIRPAMPDAARITRMDEALAWIALIPRDRYVLRRIVGCRALVSPLTERHLFTWRRLGCVLGADHKAVQRWHAQGIALIVAALNAR